MGSKAAHFCALLAAFLLGAHPLRAAPEVRRTTWRALDAFELTDGRTMAIIVPRLGGRLVHYGLRDGANWIWSGEPGAEKREPVLFWGGDKTYIGPHTMWSLVLPKTWPPPAPDYTAHEVIASDGALFATESPVWPEYGARVRREYQFNEAGDLVITHRVAPVANSHILAAVWTIAQIIPTDSVCIPVNPASPYKNDLFFFGWGTPKDKIAMRRMTPSLVELKPETGTVFKLGANPARPALAAVKSGSMFVAHAAPQEGQYPEGADGAGFSVEVYHHDAPGAGEYTELELLSPLRRLDAGATLITRWNVHPLPKEDASTAIARIIGSESDRTK